jgi:hypothetical protein
MEPVPDSIMAWLLLHPELKPLLDPSSTEEEFDEALEKHISESIQWVEHNANALHNDSEDSLSTTLAGHMSIKQLLDATREENSRGHVDITIKIISTSRRRLGEAKIYHGYIYHEKGMEQLVGRYSTGRERTGYMFCYVKDPDIKNKMATLQAECDTHRPCEQVQAGGPHIGKWAFETLHGHASGEQLRVVHFGVNLHVATLGARHTVART